MFWAVTSTSLGGLWAPSLGSHQQVVAGKGQGSKDWAKLKEIIFGFLVQKGNMDKT